MKAVNRSLDSLEVLITEEPPDIPKLRALIASIREELGRLNASQQQLIESNQALLKRFEDAAKCR